MQGRETPGNKTVRLGMEKKIAEYNNAGDMTTVNHMLDRYPTDKPRAELNSDQLIERLKNPEVARFFRPVVIEGLAA